MSKNFKNKVIENLAELLPSLVNSLMSLLDYVKDADSKLSDEVLIKLLDITSNTRKVSLSLSNELPLFQADDSSMKEIQIINELYEEASIQISKGVTTLLYLIAKENNFLERLKEQNINEKLFDYLERQDIDDAVNNLYEGSKKVIQIIDKVIDE